VQIVRFRKMVYLAKADRSVEEQDAPVGLPVSQISGTDLRARLARGADLPEWFTVPAVSHELRRRFRPRVDQGFTVFISELPGSGKSTIARCLAKKLRALGNRNVSLLDGDEARHQLSSELGFSREDRDRHALRVGYVAAEITKSSGVAVCALIAPYAASRREVRRMVEAGGGFVHVHVDTPLEVCQSRDRKDIYAKARAGLMPQFTGVSDPYEQPMDADIVVDTVMRTPDQAAQGIVEHLRCLGYLPSRRPSRRPVSGLISAA
jgi:sulfate adenylyltransferase